MALLPPYLYFDKTLRRDVLLEAKARAAEDVDTTYWLLREHPPFPSYRHLNGWVTELSRRTGTRITYIVDGHVTADSDVPYERLSTLEDHANRPEVVEARSGTLGTDVRFSATLGKDLIYAARKVDGIAGLDPGTLRLALPLSVVHDRLDRMEKGLVWAFLFSLMASGALGLLVTRPLLRGMETMAMAAQAIGQGEFGRRIRDIPGRELRPLAHAINGMAHNIEQHLRQLNEQKGRLEAVFNGMHEGVMVLDAAGRIDSMNRALTAMFTGIGNKLGATPLEATMKPELQRMVDEMLVSPDPRGASMQTDLGEGRAFEISLVPFRDASGQRMVLVFHDISEREKLEHIRRDFVANVSHELKTPLTSIKGYAETLLEGPPASPGQMSAHHPQERQPHDQDGQQPAGAGPLGAQGRQGGPDRRGRRRGVAPDPARTGAGGCAQGNRAGKRRGSRPAAGAGRPRRAGGGVPQPAGQRHQVQPAAHAGGGFRHRRRRPGDPVRERPGAGHSGKEP